MTLLPVASNPPVRLPTDDYVPEGPEVEAYFEWRDRVAAALLALSEPTGRPDADVVSPRPM